MTSWMWVLAGVAFLVLELVLPVGFYFFLLGCSAVLVGAIVAVGVLPSLNLQMAAFAILAIVFPLVFLSKLKKLFPKKISGDGNDTTGQIVKVQDTILPGATGTGELWGSPWRIKNISAIPFHKGEEVVVISAEGVTLMVTQKGS